MWDEMRLCGVGQDLEDEWFDVNIDPEANAKAAEMEELVTAALDTFVARNPHLAKAMDAPEFDLSVFLKRNLGALLQEEDDGATTDDAKGLRLLEETQESQGSWAHSNLALPTPPEEDRSVPQKADHPISQFRFTIPNPTDSQDGDCEPSPPEPIVPPRLSRRSAFPRVPPAIIIAPPSSPHVRPFPSTGPITSRASSVTSKDSHSTIPPGECKSFTVAELLGLDPSGPPPPLPLSRQKTRNIPLRTLANPLVASIHKRTSRIHLPQPELELAPPLALPTSQKGPKFEHLTTSSFPSVLSSGRSVNLRESSRVSHPKVDRVGLKQRALEGLRRANPHSYGSVDEGSERQRKFRKVE